MNKTIPSLWPPYKDSIKKISVTSCTVYQKNGENYICHFIYLFQCLGKQNCYLNSIAM